eukprot:TRINITY_DN72906_c0_g1_i1.p1 TRINITY_DN72906_c0_g1~~TRINITY_DN72906_c0_g1_i1.p1  ORF type:complete len:208 (-),score=44.43 TRINITY_DN72906_c0_g1_i1:38-661(-)
MKILVHKVLNNKRFEVELPDSATVGSLRRAVQDREGLASGSSFSLIVGENSLENDGACNQLSSFGIQAGSTVDLVVNDISFGQQLGQITQKKVNLDDTKEKTFLEWNTRKAELLEKIQSVCLDRASKMFNTANVKLFQFKSSDDMAKEIRYGLNQSQSLGTQMDFLKKALSDELETMGFKSFDFHLSPPGLSSRKMKLALKWDLVEP